MNEQREKSRFTKRVFAIALVGGLVVSLSSLSGQGQPPGQGPAAAQGPSIPLDMGRELALKIKSSFTLAAVGDVFGLVPGFSQLSDPAVQGAYKILRDADVAFANQETNMGALSQFQGPVGAWMG